MNGSAASIPEPVLRAWEDYGWPGNVRELRNAVARRLALGDLAALDASWQSDDATSQAHGATAAGEGILERIVAGGLPFPEARRRIVDELERRYVEKALAEHGGNVTRAAEASGIARRQFQRVRVRRSV